MAVYYKFKSAKDYSAVPVEGPFLSVLQLKERIVEKMRLERPPDFDLLISNSQTNEEYADEGFLVPKNTSVLVRRVPGTFRVPVITEPRPEPKVVEEPVSKVETPVKTTTSDWSDDFGVDLYEEPQTSRVQQAPQATVPVADAAAKAEEEAKIKAFCDTSASEWQRQTQQAFVGGRGRGGGGRGMGRGAGFMRKTPPDGYVCHRCNEPGHYIQHCPTNKDPSYNIKRVKLPTGIPRTMLVANPDGSYALPNGEIAVLRPNEELFEKEVVSLTSNKAVNEVPQEFRCPLCKDVLKDAVLTSKCCFKSYCDRCIRNEIISKGRCVCGATHVRADDLLPNKTLRDAIERLLESNTTTSSADNPGSRVIVPDAESVLPLAKAASPVLSITLKEQSQNLEKAVATEVKDASHKTPEASAQGDEAEVESASLKDAPEANGNTNEEGNPSQQAKKNKPKRARPPKQNGLGQQMPWMPDGIMPYGGPYWSAHPIGDGFMMPYGGGPYNGGYGVPFDVPFSAPPLLPDPYAYTGMVPPPFPQRDFPPYSKYPPSSAVMSREEFEAKKAEAWRKHENHNHKRDENGEDSSSRDDNRSRKRRSEEYDYRERQPERRDGSSRDRRSSHQHDGHSGRDERRKPSSERDRGGQSYRSSRSSYKSSEDSKRRREEASPSSTRRVSVFLRVKQEEEQERKRGGRARDESHHHRRHHHHVDTTEKENELVKSVFARIAPKM